MRITAYHRALAERCEFADIDGDLGIRGAGDIRIDDAGDAVIEQQRNVGIEGAACPHQRFDANGEGRVRDGGNAFEVED